MLSKILFHLPSVSVLPWSVIPNSFHLKNRSKFPWRRKKQELTCMTGASRRAHQQLPRGTRMYLHRGYILVNFSKKVMSCQMKIVRCFKQNYFLVFSYFSSVISTWTMKKMKKVLSCSLNGQTH